MEKIQHFSFDKELTYRELYEGIDGPVYCQACDEVISGSAYVYEFDYDHIYGLHKSCAELPRDIRHPLHSKHPLEALLPGVDVHDGFICDRCRHFSLGYCYACVKCEFRLDVQCVSQHDLTQLALREKVEIDTEYHDHKLQLFYLRRSYSDICCYCCGECINNSGYTCTRCGFITEKSCLDSLSLQVQSPFHPQHPLQLDTSYEVEDEKCRVCGFDARDLGYSCKRCSSFFHISCCVLARPPIRLDIHKHDLFYINFREDYEIRTYDDCPVCQGICDSCSYYRCLECEKSFHLECTRLPSVVKHECHPYHVLTLTNSAAVNNGSNKFRCDVCEKEERVKHDVYCCRDCFYNAHIGCVLSEVNLQLQYSSINILLLSVFAEKPR